MLLALWPRRSMVMEFQYILRIMVVIFQASIGAMFSQLLRDTIRLIVWFGGLPSSVLYAMF